MKVYGLSGGISCGKSAASRYLSESGIPVIDCDVIAKAVVVKVLPYSTSLPTELIPSQLISTV